MIMKISISKKEKWKNIILKWLLLNARQESKPLRIATAGRDDLRK